MTQLKVQDLGNTYLSDLGDQETNNIHGGTVSVYRNGRWTQGRVKICKYIKLPFVGKVRTCYTAGLANPA